MELLKPKNLLKHKMQNFALLFRRNEFHFEVCEQFATDFLCKKSPARIETQGFLHVEFATFSQIFSEFLL